MLDFHSVPFHTMRTDNSLQSLLSCTVLSGIPRYPQKLLNLRVMEVHVCDISDLFYLPVSADMQAIARAVAVAESSCTIMLLR